MLEECFGINPSHLVDPSSGSIEATGDPIVDKLDVWVRFAFQDVNGISLQEGLYVIPETATSELSKLT